MIDSIGITVSALKAMRALRMAEIVQIDTLVNQLLKARADRPKQAEVVQEQIRVTLRPAPPPKLPKPPTPPKPPKEPSVSWARAAEKRQQVTTFLELLPPGERANGKQIAAYTGIAYHSIIDILRTMRERDAAHMTGGGRWATWAIGPAPVEPEPPVAAEAVDGHV